MMIIALLCSFELDAFDQCHEKIALDVIHFLKEERPDSLFQTIKNDKEIVIGLHDQKNLYPDVAFLKTILSSERVHIDLYGYSDILFIAEYTQSCDLDVILKAVNTEVKGLLSL